MTRQAKDEAREERIHMEIIVDAYGPEEQAMGWYNYLDDTLQFPFSARCVVRRATSPLEPGEEVEVVGPGTGGDGESVVAGGERHGRHAQTLISANDSRYSATPASG